MAEKISGVYAIVNKSNGHIYIGSSINIQIRWWDHVTKLNTKHHRNRYLQRAWNKYGKDNFRFETLIICDPDMLLYYEQQFLDQWHPEYNIATNAAASHMGLKHTLKSRLKMSASQKLRPPITEETRHKQSISSSGRKHSESAKQKIREARQGEHSIHAKLTDAQVLDIRKEYATLRTPYSILSSRYNVYPSCISKIINRKTWKHLPFGDTTIDKEDK